MRRTSLSSGPCPTGPARANLSPEVAPLQPAPEQQVHAPNYRLDAYYREHCDYPEEHSNDALPSIARLRVQRNPYPPKGLP
jgi:hypothetical protein